MTPSPESSVVRWDPRGGPPRRVVYEPWGDDWMRIEYVWGGCGYWRETGRELVSDVTIDGPASSVISQTGP